MPLHLWSRAAVKIVEDCYRGVLRIPCQVVWMLTGSRECRKFREQHIRSRIHRFWELRNPDLDRWTHDAALIRCGCRQYCHPTILRKSTVDDSKHTDTTTHRTLATNNLSHHHCTSHVASKTVALAQISRDHTTPADLLHKCWTK
jgi:hypothetical protein